MPGENLAVLEIARFIANHPTPEEVINFTASDEVNERAYALIAAERTGIITADERRELDSYEAIQHIVIQAKAEAYKKLRQQAS